MQHKMNLQDEASTHVKLAQKWNELLANIRTIPKFKDFLQPPSCSNLLKNLPDSGSVIVINVHKDSCDALALSSDLDEPLHIPLHKFTFEKATNLHNQLNSYLHTANLQMRGTQLVRLNESGDVIKHILHQLWILVVKPILDGLGISVSTLGISAMLKSYSSSLKEPPSKLPRIWWCATGSLSFLPIHAAGMYATSTTKTGPILSDFAISSYIPNVRALTERVLLKYLTKGEKRRQPFSWSANQQHPIYHISLEPQRKFCQ